VHWIHAAVALGGREEHRRVTDSGPDVVILRVFPKPCELIRVLRGSVLRDPETRDPEVLIAEHVEQGHRAAHRGEKLGALRERRSYEQSAIRTTRDCEVFGVRPSGVDEIFGGGVKVIEDVLFVCEHAGTVPTLAVFAAAAEIREREESASLDPCGRTGKVRR